MHSLPSNPSHAALGHLHFVPDALHTAASGGGHFPRRLRIIFDAYTPSHLHSPYPPTQLFEEAGTDLAQALAKKEIIGHQKAMNNDVAKALARVSGGWVGGRAGGRVAQGWVGWAGWVSGWAGGRAGGAGVGVTEGVGGWDAQGASGSGRGGDGGRRLDPGSLLCMLCGQGVQEGKAAALMLRASVLGTLAGYS